MLKLEEGTYLGVNRQVHRLGKLSFFDTTYPEKVFNGWHAHERAHLTFVLNGGNREKRKNTDQQLNTGQVIFYHSQELHCNDHTLFPSRNLNLEIEPDFFDTYQLREEQFDEAVKNGKLSSLEFSKVFTEVCNNDAAAADSVHMLLLSTLGTEKCKLIPPWLYQIREMLNDRWDTYPTLAELATAVAVHPVTLSKYFHRFFGCTLGAYMRRLKTQHALIMIRTGKQPLTEICYSCGFSDQSHFIRCFKKHTGMLPKQFERF